MNFFEDDLIVIPFNTEVPADFKGHTHKMKFLANPSVVHSRRHQMSTYALHSVPTAASLGNAILKMLGLGEYASTPVVEKKPDIFLRHIRILNSKTGEYYHNKGATVLVDLRADKGMFLFSYAVCNHKDNFNKIIAHNECKARMASGRSIECVNYDPALSILQNIFIAIGVLEGEYPLTEFDYKGILPELNGDFSEEQKKGLSSLRRLIRNKAPN